MSSETCVRTVSRAIQGGRKAGRKTLEPNPAGCVPGMDFVGRSVGPACTTVASRWNEVARVEEGMGMAGRPTRKPKARESPVVSKNTLRRLFCDGIILHPCLFVR